MCRIYDEDNRAKSAHYDSLNKKQEKGQFQGKSYVTHTVRENKKLQERRSQVGEELLLRSSATSVV